jgi:hypothetical protein
MHSGMMPDLYENVELEPARFKIFKYIDIVNLIAQLEERFACRKMIYTSLNTYLSEVSLGGA